MKEHNLLRNLHEGTPPLKWDDELEMEAQWFAEKLKKLNKKQLKQEDHDPRNKANGWGENIYFGWRSWRSSYCAEAIYAW